MARTYKRDAKGRFASTGAARKGRGSRKANRAARQRTKARAWVRRNNAYVRSERAHGRALRNAPGAVRQPAKPPSRIGRALMAAQERKDRRMERRSGMKVLR